MDAERAPDTVVEVRDLTKRFDSFTAVDRISFFIRRGEIMGFLGPNGAGKTTTLKMITGLMKSTSGDIRLLGFDIRTNLRRVKPRIGYMSQKFSLYPLLTAEENVEFFAGISGLSSTEIKHQKHILRKTIPQTYLRQRASDLPPGIRQQVALFTCLISDPEIILLDEPTSGVDPENRRRFWMRIYDLKKEGKTVLVTTHNLDEAEFADRLLIMHHGQILSDGELDGLLVRERASDVEDLFKRVIAKHEKTSSRRP